MEIYRNLERLPLVTLRTKKLVAESVLLWRPTRSLALHCIRIKTLFDW